VKCVQHPFLSCNNNFESIKWETTRKNIIFLSFQTEMLIGKIHITWIAYRAEFLTGRFRKSSENPIAYRKFLNSPIRKKQELHFKSSQFRYFSTLKVFVIASNWEESKKSCNKIELKLNSKPFPYKEIRNLPVTKMQFLKRWVA
jgi:hypothetical protein